MFGVIVAVYESEVIVNESPEKVFEFFLDPNNLEEITLPELQLKVLDAPNEVQIGTQVDFQVTRFGLDLKATHEVINIDEYCITERQVTGVLKEFEQERRFNATDAGGCCIVNTITFEPPGGLVGAMMTEKKIRASLDEAFEFQDEALQKRFGSPA